MTSLHPCIAARLVHDPDSGCLVWTGALDRGYGKANLGRKNLRVHRYVYEQTVGPIPADLTLDHLCRNRACSNVEHLEPVTRGENVRRALVLPHCKRGHAFDEINTVITSQSRRLCRTCLNARRAAYRAAARTTTSLETA